MLTYMRKHSKGWMIKIIFGLIIFTFVLWGGSSYMNREENKLAKIDKHIITVQEYQKAYQNAIDAYRQQYGNFFNEEMIKMLDLKNRILEQLINNYILEQEAKKMGITVSNQDLDESIKKLPVFQTNGQYDNDKYTQILDYLKINKAVFETQQRSDMIRQRLRDIITSNVFVTKQEIEAAYHQKEDAFELNFICYTPDQFKGNVSADDAVIKGWYESHKEAYKVPPKTKITYINFDTAKYSQGVMISEEDIKGYYNDHQSEFAIPAKVHGRQIVLLLPMTADEKLIKEKEKEAQKIADEAKKGANFAELAVKYSQDRMTAKSGGDLGMVEKDKLPEGLGSVLSSMKPGDIKGPLRTQSGFRIVKLEAKEDEKTKPLQKVSALIIDKLRGSKARSEAYNAADKAFSSIFEDPKTDLSAYAKKNNLDVKEFGPFSENEIAAIPGGQKVIKDAAARQEGDLGDISDTGSGYMIYKVTGRINARIPDLAEVKDRVVADVSRDKMNEAAKNYANQTASRDIASLNAMSHDSTGVFKRSEYSLPKLGGDQKLKNEIDSLNKPKVYSINNKFCIVWINQFIKADPAGLTPARANSIKSELLRKKKETAFDDFIKDTKSKHKIEIVQDKLN